MRPTWRAVAVAAAGLLVALLPVLHTRLWPAWPLFLGGYALALGADGLLAPRARDLACSLDMPAVLAIGEPGEAVLAIRLPALRPVAVTVAFDLSEKLVPQPPRAGIAGTGNGLVACPLVPTRRGRIALQGAAIRYTGPLGLLARVAAVPLAGEANVVPDLRPVRTTALRFASERDFRAGLKIERYQGDGTEFDSLREYAPGDDPRRLDWKASAHHKKLLSRQYRAERNHQIVLAVDTGHLMCEPLGGIPKVDHAVTSALLLTYVSLRAGDRVGWITFGARVGQWLAPQGGMAGFEAASRLAGKIDYSEAETNFTLGLTTLAQRLSRRSLVIVLTDFVDTVTAELMLENLERLGRRHALLFVALKDPALAANAGAAPTDIHRLNRAVVAAGLQRDREVVLKRLRRQGVQALDAAPGEVGPQLINAYLDIKRRERI